MLFFERTWIQFPAPILAHNCLLLQLKGLVTLTGKIKSRLDYLPKFTQKMVIRVRIWSQVSLMSKIMFFSIKASCGTGPSPHLPHQGLSRFNQLLVRGKIIVIFLKHLHWHHWLVLLGKICLGNMT